MQRSKTREQEDDSGQSSDLCHVPVTLVGAAHERRFWQNRKAEHTKSSVMKQAQSTGGHDHAIPVQNTHQISAELFGFCFRGF
jgi:hypothetical protein